MFSVLKFVCERGFNLIFDFRFAIFDYFEPYKSFADKKIEQNANA